MCFKVSRNDTSQVLEPVRVQGSTEECAICLCSLTDPMKHVEKLSCTHNFHEECITEWKKRSSTCPMCRQDNKTNEFMDEIRGILSFMVKNNLVKETEANIQHDAMEKFSRGKMSYAEMRMMCG